MTSREQSSVWLPYICGRKMDNMLFLYKHIFCFSFDYPTWFKLSLGSLLNYHLFDSFFNKILCESAKNSFRITACELLQTTGCFTIHPLVQSRANTAALHGSCWLGHGCWQPQIGPVSCRTVTNMLMRSQKQVQQTIISTAARHKISFES